MAVKLKILVYGYGNPGRQDDVLGVKLTEEVKMWAEKSGYDIIQTDSNYQLNIEDAATISDKDLVIFADASKEEIADFEFTRLNPDSKVDFSMHHVSPAFILHLCNEIYGSIPEAYLLHIKGYQWDFMGEITPEAESNFKKAFDFIQKYLSDFTLSSRQ